MERSLEVEGRVHGSRAPSESGGARLPGMWGKKESTPPPVGACGVLGETGVGGGC
jgi:hypothetical protein